jgi:hypothetical protein
LNEIYFRNLPRHEDATKTTRRTFMKKLILALAMTAFGFGSLAQAQSYDLSGKAPEEGYYRDGSTPIWTCNMKFAGEAHGLQVVLGRFTLNATGTIYCWNPLGGTQTIPVLVTMKSGIVSPNISAGKFHFTGRSLDLSLGNLSPEKLLGRYRVAHTRGAFIGGAGAITGVKVGIPQLALKVSIEFDSGFGFSVGLNRMMVELDESRVY